MNYEIAVADDDDYKRGIIATFILISRLICEIP